MELEFDFLCDEVTFSLKTGEKNYSENLFYAKIDFIVFVRNGGDPCYIKKKKN